MTYATYCIAKYSEFQLISKIITTIYLNVSYKIVLLLIISCQETKLGQFHCHFTGQNTFLVPLAFLLNQQGRSSIGSLILFSFIRSRLDFTRPEGRLVGGGGQEFQQIDFADQPFTAVGVGGEFALADVGGDGVLAHTGPACGVQDREHVWAFSVKFL